MSWSLIAGQHVLKQCSFDMQHCFNGISYVHKWYAFIKCWHCNGQYWVYCLEEKLWPKSEARHVLTVINSSPPSAAYMRQWTGPSLVQVMACCLFGTKPLPEPMLAYCQLDSWERISVTFESEFYHFHSRICIWKSRLPKWRPCCPGGGDEFIYVSKRGGPCSWICKTVGCHNTG